ncbi:Multidrug resistance operon repressor [Massilia sp. Bi118]|uniref:MarR family winged helix-turn-helix transcriptional regulator n=1 Tax=Massilia sp. Bi118 TaxID=2822346 RepID=UPI001DEA3737|nr:MarR family transcriptional regulator [Massilia sp. Bi118]CAH0281964.1 Multidrug resistance operon repressor [Massilia sp. Bi118]
MPKQVDQVNQKPVDDVLETMHAIMHLYRSAQHRSLRDGPNDLAHMEVKALGFFARHPGATQSELVAHSGRDKAQVARQIRALRERGLLEARADEADRRSAHLYLSEQGRAVHAALHSNDGRLKEAALQGFTAQEQGALLDLLARVRANLQAMPD